MAKTKAAAPAFEVDAICASVIEGQMLSAIATKAGRSKAALLAWIEADPDRSARVRDARAEAAGSWDEKAEQVIDRASDPFELAKARELAQHYRWRASKIGHKVYGDKLDLKHSGGVSVVPVTPTDEAL